MHHFIYPSGDATMYKVQNTQNTGLDEIIEIEKAYYNNTLREIARGLLKFDISSISSSIAGGTISKNHKFYLNLKIAQAHQIPLTYTLYIYPVSQSWQNGVGTKFDGVTTTGVSWLYRDSGDAATKWVSGSTLITGSLGVGTTGSIDGTGGGAWYTASVASQSFDYESADIRMDVSSIVHQWLSGSIPNEGMIVKHSFAVEEDSQDYGTLKFYSRDTHTIFPPTLEVAWDGSTITSGSLSEITDEDRIVKVKNLRKDYRQDSKPRFRVFARSLYPARTFSAGSPYNTNKYLPTASYYSIVDADTEYTIVPFSDYTKLSVDVSGSFFDQWLSGFQPERFYRVVIKVTKNGLTDYYDIDDIFKVVR